MSAPRHRLLVIGDESSVHESERRFLEDAGFEVAGVVDGCHSTGLLRRVGTDLVLLDLRTSDRIETLQRIRVDWPDRPRLRLGRFMAERSRVILVGGWRSP